MTHSLPLPDQDAAVASSELTAAIKQAIHRNGGSIPFSQYMEMALYFPKLGYYSGGSHKIGAAGDFITAPTLSPLFGQTLAKQLAQLLPQTAGNLYEFGAGTGVLAATLLNSLGDQCKKYYIIEISSELSDRQRQYIAKNAPEFADKVEHLRELPEEFDGILIGNEVLDAMPCELVKRENGHVFRQHVGIENDGLQIQNTALNPQDPLFQAALQYFPDCDGYTSELHPAQYAFIATLAERLQRGAMILIDYGFNAAQYYHPQRNQGTLIGHYRHHTVHDPFFLPGLVDLTAHVNFTDIAQAGCDAGLDLIGYTNQAAFLLNLGITDILVQNFPDSGNAAYVQAASAFNTLTAPHEMGELFKVIAFGRDIDVDWIGFENGDICHKL